MNEIEVIGQVVDMAIANGLFKNRAEANQVIHCMGVVTTLANKGLEAQRAENKTGPTLTKDSPEPAKAPKHKGN